MSATDVKMTRLNTGDIEQRLRQFERTHRLATGEELASAEFFERFKHGEFDSLFGMRWAGYVRALSRARD